jgi:hypothetical protein
MKILTLNILLINGMKLDVFILKSVRIDSFLLVVLVIRFRELKFLLLLLLLLFC